MTMYTITRRESGTVTMGDRSTQPQTFATIRQDGKFVTEICLNATTFSAGEPYGTGRGIDATDDQIIVAVLGDEHIFSGAPSFPEHHDNVTQEN